MLEHTVRDCASLLMQTQLIGGSSQPSKSSVAHVRTRVESRENRSRISLRSGEFSSMSSAGNPCIDGVPGLPVTPFVFCWSSRTVCPASKQNAETSGSNHQKRALNFSNYLIPSKFCAALFCVAAFVAQFGFVFGYHNSCTLRKRALLHFAGIFML